MALQTKQPAALRLHQLLHPLKEGGDLAPGLTLERIWFEEAIALRFTAPGESILFHLKPAARQDTALARSKHFLLAVPGPTVTPTARKAAGALMALIAHHEKAFRKIEYAEMAAALRKDVPVVLYGDTAEARLLVRCNESCGFCHTNEQAENLAMDKAAYQKLLEDFRAGGARLLVISGGEPTLLPDLADYIAMGKTAGFKDIELQTNAVKLKLPGRSAALKAAGLTRLFISLHSSRSETLAAITGHQQALRDTTAGIQACLAQGLPVTINHVVNALNLADLPTFPGFLKTTFGSGLDKIVFSVASPNFPEWRSSPLLPEPGEAGPLLSVALRRAIGLGYQVFVPSLCGLPACVLEADVRHVHEDLAHTIRDPWLKRDRVHGQSCASCALNHRCTGVWARTRERFGEDWLLPVSGQP